VSLKECSRQAEKCTSVSPWFKAKVNGYYNCSDSASPAIYIDAVATAALPVAGIFVNHAHVRLEAGASDTRPLLSST
jgi:hypothetical protein